MLEGLNNKNESTKPIKTLGEDISLIIEKYKDREDVKVYQNGQIWFSKEALSKGVLDELAKDGIILDGFAPTQTYDDGSEEWWVWDKPTCFVLKDQEGTIVSQEETIEEFTKNNKFLQKDGNFFATNFRGADPEYTKEEELIVEKLR